ncbi:DUF4198 domain-containing protein [Stutzerimonas xanthomarina]|uniref:Uncharacterized conserved protein, contains GH25 family domain n=3 Tax=Stutzerimonas xanthomarina TaxID=271420 RepID=A0A1M5LE00_9GAMM|nr:DUF4198 domain-containing protein [Stutzerimonas xanthomarina]SEH52940.1 Uncharacterized conserved protein, contains GH25 family domain [Stutzerimonas xanthomarina]SHG63334.1 Uncharacterized conserved protein, contains GH25 family domain [Stutzerimonas xanthomarina DSM 18231]
MNKHHAKYAMTLIAALMAGQAAAHGMWTEERRGNIEVIYGHGAEDNAFDPKKISGAWATDRHGSRIPVTVERLENHARLKPIESPAVLSVALDNGYWTQAPDKQWLNVGESKVPGALDSGRYYKYSLAVLHEGAELPALDKLKLAIVPQRDPLSVEVGEALEVQVLVDGKPAADVELIADHVNNPDEVAATTNKQGKAKITVRNHGLNVIAASTTVPSEDPDARVRGMFSSLSFVSAKHEH